MLLPAQLLTPLVSAALCPPPQASRPADAAEQTRLQAQAFEAINEVREGALLLLGGRLF